MVIIILLSKKLSFIVEVFFLFLTLIYLIIMAHFTNEDYLNLLICYGESNRIVNRTLRLFNEKYPTRNAPTRKVLVTLLKHCINSGTFCPKRNKEKPISDNEEAEINVMGFFYAHPQASIRDAERALRLSKTTIHKILKKHKFHPFKIQIVHHLKPEDLPRRVTFCEFILIKYQENENFLNNIIWTDEAKFSKNGMHNRHNSHYWATENPHMVRETNFQDSFSFNVFCAIKSNQILCFHIYQENLNGERYSEILNTVVREALNTRATEELLIYFFFLINLLILLVFCVV